MRPYSFDIKNSYSEITNNRDFIDGCFASIRDGNPLMYNVGDYHRRVNDPIGTEITCLEYIMDAIRESGGDTGVDVAIFDYLADPSINLEQQMCHVLGEGELHTTTHCIPKIITAFQLITKPKLAGSNKMYTLLRDMSTILERYPHLVTDEKCRYLSIKNSHLPSTYGQSDIPSYATCFEKLMNSEIGIANLIDINHLPDNFLDTACNGGKCYGKIANDATVNNQYHLTQNSRTLLEEMIISKKFEQQLYNDKYSGNQFVSSSANSIIGTTPLESIYSRECGTYKLLLLKTLIGTYTIPEGIIDVTSETSPFSGDKCKGYDPVSLRYSNCLEQAIILLPEYLSFDATKNDVSSLIELIMRQPKYSTGCGGIRLASLLYSTSRSPSINSIRPFESLEQLEHMQCESDVGGTNHTVSGLDYALELGSPIEYQLSNNYETIDNVIVHLNKEPCKSLSTGGNIPCLEKLTKELLVDYTSAGGYGLTPPRVNSNIYSIINRILDGISPDTIRGFANHLVSGIHATTVRAPNLHVEMMATLKMALTHMTRYTGNYTHESGDTPRFDELIGAITNAHVVSGFHFAKPTIIREAIMDMFSMNERETIDFINSGLFEYGLQKNIISTLANLFYKYKKSDIIPSLITTTLKKRESLTLQEFMKAHSHAKQRRKTVNDMDLTDTVVELFNHMYGKSMEEYFKPSLESRMLFDGICFKNPNADDHGFLTQIYDDVPGHSKLRNDPKRIVGVYNISVGNTGMWGDERILNYLKTMKQIMYGTSDIIGAPYIMHKENMRPVPVGLVQAIDDVSVIEPVGRRTEHKRGKIHISFEPTFVVLSQVSNTTENVLSAFRAAGNDITVTLYYVDENGAVLDTNQTKFKLMDILQNLPKKLKTKIQEKYPFLLGQIDVVTAVEKSISETAEASAPKIETYKMTISNKPTDIIRSSACQGWDKLSCMSIFGGGHNMSLEGYLDNGSYIAYLTKESEYEPQWLARLFMHQCKNCNCLSVQDSHRYYEVDVASRKYPNWNLLHDAVKTVLADKGINNADRGSSNCKFAWGSNRRDDVENNGDPHCDDAIDEASIDCIEEKESECRDRCISDDALDEYSDAISEEIQEKIDSRVSTALSDDPSLEDDEDRKSEIVEKIEEEVREELESDLMDDKIQECKDDCKGCCGGDCDYIAEDFDCWEYLINNDYVSSEDDVYTDDDYYRGYIKDSVGYKSILIERTGQDFDSSAFVKQVKATF
jgi:hypothetical protein